MMTQENNSFQEIKEIGLNTLKREDDTIRHIERKAEIILGFIGVILPIFIYTFKDLLTNDSMQNFCLFVTYKILISLTIIFLFVSGILSLLSLIIRKFYQIDFCKIWEKEKSRESDISLVRKRLIEHIYQIHKKNEIAINSKAEYMKYSFITFIIGLGVSFILLMFILYSI